MRKLYISAIEHAVPEASLNLEGEVGGAHFSATDRRSALDSEYVEKTGNSEPFDAKDSFLTTPTNLGVQGAEKALSTAGITTEDLGLLLAGTATPVETIPTEAQRIGKELGVKIPAYDIQCGGADLALYLETLGSWKEERIPEYTLLASTHLPTARLDYRSDDERYFFGDGAGVAVVSKKSGLYSVEHSESRIYPDKQSALTIDLYGHLKCDFNVESEVFLPKLKELYDSIQSKLSSDVTFIESQLTPGRHEELRGIIGGDNWISHVGQYGNILGGSPFISLSLAKDEIKTEQIVVLQSGIGLSTGVVILKREG